MKSLSLVAVVVPLVAFGACSQSGPNVMMTGNGGSGGDSAGAAGSGGSTGAAGSGGSTGAGGTAGSGGATGAGGTAGTGGAGGGGNMIDTVTGVTNNNGFALKNSWMLFPCYQNPTSQDCQTIPAGMACPNQNTALPFEQQGVNFSETFTVGGTPGTMYMMTIQVNGITEGKYYSGGARQQTAAPADPEAVAGIDMFYTGGTPVNVENYNVYKITVFNNATPPVEIQHYYLNSAPANTGTTYEAHNSFPLGYTAHIPVMGGGTVQYFEADRNCRAIDNCGAAFGGRSTPCAVTDGRTIPNEATATIPTMWQGKTVSSLNVRNGSAQPFHAQVIHITVTDVSPM